MTFDLENPGQNPGDELRDLAANLLSQRYGNVKTEKRVGGKKADIYFEKNELNKTVRFYVEAKDYSKKLTRAQVNHIFVDYHGALQRVRPSELIIITRHGIATDAEEFIDENNVRHLTIWQLEKEVLGLTPYVQELAGLFGYDGLNQYYVEALAQKASYDGEDRQHLSETKDLFSEVLTWINSDDHAPLAILGGYGAGKSSFAKRLVSHLANSALKNPTDRQPILIELGAYTRYSNIDGILGAKFTSDRPLGHFNFNIFLNFNKLGRLVIVLDGFDEMKHAMTWSDFRLQIEQLNTLCQGRSKIILLGRPSAFTSNDEHFQVLRGLKKLGSGFRKLPDWPEFIEYDIMPFSVESRRQFLSKYLAYKISESHDARLTSLWLEERVIDVNALCDVEAELFTKPVHNKILADLATDPDVDLKGYSNGISRWDLYSLFFSSLIERELSKNARHGVGERARLNFLRELAVWLWESRDGATSFDYNDIPNTVFGADYDPSGDHEDLKREYLIGSILEKKQGATYYFAHRSFAEFLVADRLLQKVPTGADHNLYASLLTEGVSTFLAERREVYDFGLWLSDLTTSKVTITRAYVNLLLHGVGNREKALALTKPNRAVRKILECFGDQIEFTESTISALLNTSRDDDLATFWLAHNLLVSALWINPEVFPDRWRERYVVAVLTRLFRNVELYNDTRKGELAEAKEECKDAAAALFVSTQPSQGDVILKADFEHFESYMRMNPPRHNITFIYPKADGPVMKEKAQFRLSKLMDLFEKDDYDKIWEYFKRNSGLAGLYISQRNPARQARSSPKLTGRFIP